MSDHGIVDRSALDLSAAIARREVSAAEVMAAHLARIDRLNGTFNAIVSRRDSDVLMAEARAADAAIAAGQRRGWLHGLPVAIKDLADARGLPTTQGSPLFRDAAPAAADDPHVARMRAAGAIVIGKTNTPEFGLGSHTYNPVFGATRNAFDPALSAGGSSGGAAVALALRMVPVADGSDHAGSLRNPAAFNGVLGFRPTPGRVPDGGDEMFLPRLAVSGPMARSASDLAALLATMAGPDPSLPTALDDPGETFAAPPDRDLAGVRMGWLGDFDGHLPTEPGLLDLCRRAAGALEAAGAIVEPARPEFDMERLFQAWLRLRHWAVGAGLVAHWRDPAQRALLKPEAVWEVERGLALSAFDIAEAAAVRSEWFRAVARLFERFDYLLLPAAQVFPFPVGETWPRRIAGREMDTYHRWMEVVIPVTMAGGPAAAVPAGFAADGRPAGLQIWGRWRDDLGVLQMARAYERCAPQDAFRRPAAAAG